MRIYKVTADCLVDWCMLTWYITAKNEREAWFKAWRVVRNSNVADEGSFDCVRVKDVRKEYEKCRKEGVKLLTV